MITLLPSAEKCVPRDGKARDFGSHSGTNPADLEDGRF
jgi:hypothetical protein